MKTPKIDGASVKVMRSFDYCHFEVCISSSDADTPEAIDTLRKMAARLTDKAVAQYQIAKAEAQKRIEGAYDRMNLASRIERCRAIPESERSPELQAEIKAFDDEKYNARREYDYEADWNEDGNPQSAIRNPQFS